MNRIKRAVSVILLLVVTGGGIVMLCGTSQAEAENPYRELQLLTDVIAIVRRSYVDEVPMQKLIAGAINGMLTALDPHSSYMPAEEYKEMKIDMAGEFIGLGIDVTIKNGEVVVIAPLEDSPAARAGIEPGDRVVRIDGRFMRDLENVTEAVRLMRGARGSSTTITIMRDGFEAPRDFVLIREMIKIRSVRGKTLEPGFAYVRLAQFQGTTATELEKVLAELHKENGDGLKGLVLDLRNNSGGLLDQAVMVSDLFLESGLIVYTEGREPGSKVQFAAHQKGTEPSYPLIVLINSGSASAAEIVAGALKDQGRALILGTQSFGKGSVQTIVPLRDDSGLRLTTARYFTPKGISIQASGITPDIVVTGSEFKEGTPNPHAFREKDLRNHISAPIGSNGTSGSAVKDEKGEKEKKEGRDNQLQHALEILKGSQILDLAGRGQPGADGAR